MAKIRLLKKLQIKSNPDDATDNILMYKAYLLIEVCFKYYSFHYLKANFVLQFFHI